MLLSKFVLNSYHLTEYCYPKFYVNWYYDGQVIDSWWIDIYKRTNNNITSDN
jgi:hypothetical protein